MKNKVRYFIGENDNDKHKYAQPLLYYKAFGDQVYPVFLNDDKISAICWGTEAFLLRYPYLREVEPSEITLLFG